MLPTRCATCSTIALFGEADSSQAVFCAKHTSAAMIHVISKTCGINDCSNWAVYGVPGTRKAEFCVHHAKVEHETNYTATRASFGEAGSSQAVFNVKHTSVGMVDVTRSK